MAGAGRWNWPDFKPWRPLRRPATVLGLLLISLAVLPLAMASTLSSASTAQMRLQAEEISHLATGIRSYYADNVIARLQAAGGQARYSENYRNLHGGIPIPATLSIELGELFSENGESRVAYDFISDYPFAQRSSRPLDRFEQEALQAFRANPSLPQFSRSEAGALGPVSYRLATPVRMRQACVSCHNSHPDSPKRDWQVGDVRGIQEVTVRNTGAAGMGQLGFLVGYAGLVGLVSVGSTAVFQRQSRDLRRANGELQAASSRESELADQLRGQLQELAILGAVVDQATFGVCIADMRRHDAPLIYVNEAFCRITGYSREKATGFNCRYLQGPDTDPHLLQAIREAISRGESFSGELLNYRADGTPFWNRLILYPVGGLPQQPDFYVGNQLDVTAIRHAVDEEGRLLSSLHGPLSEALQATRGARRFSAGLRSRLASRELLDPSLGQQFDQELAALAALEQQLEQHLERIQP